MQAPSQVNIANVPKLFQMLTSCCSVTRFRLLMLSERNLTCHVPDPTHSTR
jgi:hypothetical protein